MKCRKPTDAEKMYFQRLWEEDDRKAQPPAPTDGFAGSAVEIISLSQRGINSTLFTECCGITIGDEATCPECGRNVIGYDKPENERRHIRWSNATRYWKNN